MAPKLTPFKLSSLLVGIGLFSSAYAVGLNPRPQVPLNQTSSQVSTRSPALQQAPYTEFLLEVVVNEKDLHHVALVLYKKGTYYIEPAELKIWRLRVQPQTQAIVYKDLKFIPLKSIPGIHFEVDKLTMTLHVTLPADDFLTTAEHLKQQPYLPPPPPYGAYINYNALVDKLPSSESYSTEFDGAFFTPHGILTDSYLVTHSSQPQTTQGIRLQTAWTIDNPSNMTMLRVGDDTSAATIWGEQVLFGGIQYATDFATQPNFIENALPSIKGEAVLPSNVQVFIDNALLYRGNVPSGPFTLDQIPTVTGNGELRVVTTNTQGQQQVQYVPYYTSNELLKPGLHNFSYSAGFIRQNFGIDSNDYGHFAAEGTDEIGINHYLTTEWHAELMQQQQTIGLGANILASRFGVVTVATAASKKHADYGALSTLGYTYQSQHFNYGLNLRYATPSYTEIGLDNGTTLPLWQSQIFGGIQFASIGSIGLGYIKQTGNGRTVTLDYSKTLDRGWFLNIAAIDNNNSTTGKAVLLTVTYNFANSTSLSLASNLQRDNYNSSITLNHSTPITNGFGYSVTGQTGQQRSARNFNGALNYQSNYGLLGVATNMQSGQQPSYQFTAQGSVIIMNRKALLSKTVSNSFALVHTPGFNNLNVYENNSLIGKTGADGYMLVPDLVPFTENTISIHGDQLPLDISAEALKQTVSPYENAGSLVTFNLEHHRSATARLVQGKGKAIPAGAKIYVNGHIEPTPVGYDGEVYLTNLTQVNTLKVRWSQHVCVASIRYPKTTQPQPYLGNINCIPQQTRSTKPSPKIGVGS